jgi:hypothetical protein
MPLTSPEAMRNKIVEQQAEIETLKAVVAQLRSFIENQKTIMLARELGAMITNFPEKLENPIIGSINSH